MQCLDLPEGSKTPIHTKHSIRDYQLQPTITALLQLMLQFLHVCSSERGGGGRERERGRGGKREREREREGEMEGEVTILRCE